MDHGSPKVAAESAVMTVRTRTVGTARTMRLLGILLALCLCLTAGRDFTALAAAEPWCWLLDPSRAPVWGPAGIPGAIPEPPTVCASPGPGCPAAPSEAL